MTSPVLTFRAANSVVVPLRLSSWGHCRRAALFHRQARLRAVKRLNLALFIDAQNQRPIWWRQIQADDVSDPRLRGGRLFSTNFGSFDSLNLPTKCGLSPASAQMRCTLV